MGGGGGGRVIRGRQRRRDIMTRLKLGPWLFEKGGEGEGEGNVLERESGSDVEVNRFCM